MRRLLRGVSFVSSIALAATAPAAVFYSNDFSGTGSNTDLPYEGAIGSWSVGSGVYTYTQAGPGSAGSTALVNLGTDLNAVGTFTVSTQFKVTALSGSGANANQIGFVLNSDINNPTSTTGNWYFAALTIRHDGATANVGDLSFAGVGTGSFNTSAVGETGLTTAGILNTNYTLVLKGNRTASSLALTLSLYDAAGTTQIGASATATDTSGILTGAYSGVRFRGVMGGTHTAQFDNVSIVPEPGSLALLSGIALMMRRRCR